MDKEYMALIGLMFSAVALVYGVGPWLREWHNGWGDKDE